MPRGLSYAFFDLNGGKFSKTVQLVYYDSAIYCFLSCYIYAHGTKSSHVMKNQLKEHEVSKQSPST